MTSSLCGLMTSSLCGMAVVVIKHFTACVCIPAHMSIAHTSRTPHLHHSHHTYITHTPHLHHAHTTPTSRTPHLHHAHHTYITRTPHLHHTHTTPTSRTPHLHHAHHTYITHTTPTSCTHINTHYTQTYVVCRSDGKDSPGVWGGPHCSGRHPGDPRLPRHVHTLRGRAVPRDASSAYRPHLQRHGNGAGTRHGVSVGGRSRETPGSGAI